MNVLTFFVSLVFAGYLLHILPFCRSPSQFLTRFYASLEDVKEHAEPVKVLGELVKVDPADRAASRRIRAVKRFFLEATDVFKSRTV